MKLPSTYHNCQTFRHLGGTSRDLTAIVLNLNEDAPTAKSFVTDLPIYQPRGGILHNSMIYDAVQGNIESLADGLKQHPRVVRVDPATLKAERPMNSYYGFLYGGLERVSHDLHAIDPIGTRYHDSSSPLPSSGNLTTLPLPTTIALRSSYLSNASSRST